MNKGYLCLQTRLASPGLVRILIREHLPETGNGESEPEIRYAARFNDVEAAQMHAQNSLRSRLLDVNNRIYRVGLIDAMAAIESDDLHHQRAWIDPSLSKDELQRLESLAGRYRRRSRRIDRIWQTVGSIAVAILVLLLVTSL